MMVLLRRLEETDDDCSLIVRGSGLKKALELAGFRLMHLAAVMGVDTMDTADVDAID